MKSAAYSLLTLFCLLHCPSTASLADPPRYIGPNGSPQRMELVGCSRIPAESIRQGLVNDTEFQLCCRPTTYWNTWRRVLGERLALGYQRAGFPNAQIHVGWDEPQKRPRVSIVEGPRSLCGPVRLEIPGDIDQQVILKRLLAPTPQFTPVRGMSPFGQASRMWTEGQPAACDAITAQSRNQRIEQALAELGFFFPTVSNRVEHQPEGGAATLAVSVRDFGPPGVVQNIRITGLLKNEESDVLSHCGLKLGQNVTLYDLKAAEQKLTETGRFWTIDISPRRVAGDEGIQLDIQAIEYVAAPRLKEELTELQLALLRIATWMNGFARSDDNLVVEISWKIDDTPIEMTAIAAPQDGWIMKCSGSWDGFQFDHAVVAEPDRQSVYSLRTGTWFQAVDVDMQPGLQLMLHPSVNRQTREWQSRFVFGIGAGNQHGGQGLRCEAIPVCFIRESLKHAENWRFEGQRLRYQEQHLDLQFDVESGRLVDGRFQLDEFQIHVSLTRDTFQKTLAELNQRCPATARVQSITTFAIQELAAGSQSETHQEALTPAARELMRTILRPVDEMIAARLTPHQQPPQHRFWIPKVTQGPQVQTMDFVAVVASNLADTLFPAGSWPWTLARETAYSAAGISGSFPQLQALMQDREFLGPLGFVMIGAHVRQFSPSIASQFLTEGSSRLHVDEFRNDLEVLLTGESPMAAAIADASEGFRKLDDSDFEALIQGSPSSWRPVLARLNTHIRQTEQTTATAGLLTAAKELWAPFVEPRLRPFLQPDLAAEPGTTRRR